MFLVAKKLGMLVGEVLDLLQDGVFGSAADRFILLDALLKVVHVADIVVELVA